MLLDGDIETGRRLQLQLAQQRLWTATSGILIATQVNYSSNDCPNNLSDRYKSIVICLVGNISVLGDGMHPPISFVFDVWRTRPFKLAQCRRVVFSTSTQEISMSRYHYDDQNALKSKLNGIIFEIIHNPRRRCETEEVKLKLLMESTCISGSQSEINTPNHWLACSID